MKCTLCLSCPICAFRLNSKETLEKVEGKDSIYTIYTCHKCGYDTSNFEYLKIERSNLKTAPNVKEKDNITDKSNNASNIVKEQTNQKKLV